MRFEKRFCQKTNLPTIFLSIFIFHIQHLTFLPNNQIIEMDQTIYVSGRLKSSRRGLYGMFPGWYKLKVTTPCETKEQTKVHYDGTPNQDPFKECPLIHPFQPLKVKHPLKNKLNPSNADDTPFTQMTTQDGFTTLPIDRNSSSVPVSNRHLYNQVESYLNVALNGL